MRAFVVAAAALAGFVATPAFAGDLVMRQPAVVVPPPPASTPWAGLYGGVNIGGGFSSPETHGTVIGGGQLGYNWQFGTFVVGGEADIQGMGLRRSALLSDAGGNSVLANSSVDYFGTVRGRIGLAYGRWLPYLTGGLAYTTLNHDGLGIAGVAGTYSASYSKIGYAVGAGIEWAFVDRWIARAEYLFVDVAGQTNTYTTTTPTVVINDSDLKLNAFRLGLNYRFSP
jgi:outer membrane immunogenic protein